MTTAKKPFDPLNDKGSEVQLPFVRNPYNYNMNKAGDESGLECKDKSLTKQSFLEETNINTIVERFHITGELPTNVRMPTYDDFGQVFDFHSAMNAIAQANEAFDQMPAAVRARFQNDPAEFLDFCSKEENRADAIKMGLVPAPAPEPLQQEQPRLAGNEPVPAKTKHSKRKEPPEGDPEPT